MTTAVTIAAIQMEMTLSELAGFETFTKRMSSTGKKPFVTIQKRGLLSINKAAYTAMGEPAAVELLFNPKERVIAVRPVAEEVNHAYPVRPLGGGGASDASSYLIGATAFTQYYEIPTEVSIRREVEIRDKVLFLDLKTEGVPVGLRRRAKDANQSE